MSEPVVKPKESRSVSWVWVGVFIVLLGIGIYGYTTYNLANRALNSISLEENNIKIINVSLTPLSVTLRLTARIDNPSSENVNVSGKIDYYTNGVFITSFNINNQLVLAHTNPTINIDTQVTTESLIALLQSGGSYNYQGSIEAQYTILGFIPIKVSQNISG